MKILNQGIHNKNQLDGSSKSCPICFKVMTRNDLRRLVELDMILDMFEYPPGLPDDKTRVDCYIYFKKY